MVKDYLGNPIEVGDPVIYLGPDKEYKRGTVKKLKEGEFYTVGILKDKSKTGKLGYTYAERCINIKYLISTYKQAG